MAFHSDQHKRSYCSASSVKRILFFGSDDFSLHSLRALLDEKEYEVEVVTRKPKKAGARLMEGEYAIHYATGVLCE